MALRPGRAVVLALIMSLWGGGACGGSELAVDGPAEGGPTLDAASMSDGAFDATAGRDATAVKDALSTSACIPGQSVACVGPGGCPSNQVCSADGASFGPCTCASGADAAVTHCVPGQSVACAGPGGCISSQVCSADGSGYGPCDCAGADGSPLACVPGQSIACGGPLGCASYQVCDASGTGYGPCDCPDAISYVNDAGDWPDGYAHLPPPQGNQGYNAIWSAALQTLYLPLFSAPDCSVIPPYGEAYAVTFRPSGTTGPSGTFPACWGAGTPTCYDVNYWNTGDGSLQDSQGDVYTLSPFGADDLATGQMQTNQGIVPLLVKSCP